MRWEDEERSDNVEDRRGMSVSRGVWRRDRYGDPGDRGPLFGIDHHNPAVGSSERAATCDATQQKVGADP